MQLKDLSRRLFGKILQESDLQATQRAGIKCADLKRQNFRVAAKQKDAKATTSRKLFTQFRIELPQGSVLGNRRSAFAFPAGRFYRQNLVEVGGNIVPVGQVFEGAAGLLGATLVVEPGLAGLASLIQVALKVASTIDRKSTRLNSSHDQIS